MPQHYPNQVSAYKYLVGVLQSMLSNLEEESFSKYQLLKIVTLSKVLDESGQEGEGSSLACSLWEGSLQNMLQIFEKFEQLVEEGLTLDFINYLQNSRGLSREKCSKSLQCFSTPAGQQQVDKISAMESKFFAKFMNLARLIQIQSKMATVLNLARQKEQSLRAENQKLRKKLQQHQTENKTKLTSQYYDAQQSLKQEIKRLKQHESDLQRQIKQLNQQLQRQALSLDSTVAQNQAKLEAVIQKQVKIEAEFQRLLKFDQQFKSAFRPLVDSPSIQSVRDYCRSLEERVQEKTDSKQAQLRRLVREVSQLQSELNRSRSESRQLRQQQAEQLKWSQEFDRHKGQVEIILQALSSMQLTLT